MAEKQERQEGKVAIPKVSFEGDDKMLKEQVTHYEKGTRRIIIFTVVGLLMGWFSYRYYEENFLLLKIILAVPYKLSEMLHNAVHPAVYAWPWAEDAFFPQAPILSRLAEYGTSALFGGAIYGSLAYFTGDKRIFTLSKYVRFGCIWAAVIGVWTAALLGGNALQVAKNNDLKDVSGFIIMGEYSSSGYYLDSRGERKAVCEALVDAFYEGEGPVETAADIRDPEEEREIDVFFGKHQGYMKARIHEEKGYLVTDEERVYEMTDDFLKLYEECLEREDQRDEEVDD